MWEPMDPFSPPSGPGLPKEKIARILAFCSVNSAQRVDSDTKARSSACSTGRFFNLCFLQINPRRFTSWAVSGTRINFSQLCNVSTLRELDRLGPQP